MNVTLIAAIAANGVIGTDNEIPWDYPEDLKHFRNTTLGHPVIMGRVTYESIVEATGGPLPDRRTIVLTRNSDSVDTSVTEETSGHLDMETTTNVHTARGVDEALAIAAVEDTDTVFIAGGASVYEQFLPVADRLLFTEINDGYDGDTYFPEWDRDAWVETARDDRDDLSFVTYHRVEAVADDDHT